MGKEARHNEGVYLTLCLRQSGISQIHSIKVLNLATVDALGCDYIIPCGFFANSDYPLWEQSFFAFLFHKVLVFHIGVGSDVVCSTLIGDARASDCGTDNR